MIAVHRELGGANGYTATGLALVSWSNTDPTVKVELDRVPKDVRPEQFMTRMIEQVLAATSVSQHVDVRSLIERRELAVTEEDEIAELTQ
ncbi:hypothetical protein MTE01_16810 [Microbacterium testaceum]|uniref:Uncharacterized protein n=1 Tax=Microbacterium testaceum TaxID=2033 RepID=A0A4Y3QJZ9_MICTE|nr:hypothetical protein [Microbacterium testaceum]GEB45736.1 hypothetical protein MTE01_16810 [Microbacterium testaceum]